MKVIAVDKKCAGCKKETADCAKVFCKELGMEICVDKYEKPEGADEFTMSDGLLDENCRLRRWLWAAWAVAVLCVVFGVLGILGVI